VKPARRQAAVRQQHALEKAFGIGAHRPKIRPDGRRCKVGAIGCRRMMTQGPADGAPLRIS
jgi:hypothetical protein